MGLVLVDLSYIVSGAVLAGILRGAWVDGFIVGSLAAAVFNVFIAITNSPKNVDSRRWLFSNWFRRSGS